MARMKFGTAAAGVIVVLLGVVAVATMGGDNGRNRAVTVANQPGTKVAGAPAARNGAQMTLSPQPTVQDVQKVLAGIMAQMTPPPGAATTASLTKEQVEAELREQLKLLGITY